MNPIKRWNKRSTSPRKKGAPMKKLRIPLRAVLYKEGEYWIAHCLELDLLGHGNSPPESLSMLAHAIGAQLETCLKNDAFDCFFSPAEPKYFRMFAAGTDVVAKGSLEISTPADDDGVTIEPIEAREYNESIEREDCGLELVDA